MVPLTSGNAGVRLVPRGTATEGDDPTEVVLGSDQPLPTGLTGRCAA